MCQLNVCFQVVEEELVEEEKDEEPVAVEGK
jgi:hypothetical protein